MQFSFFSKDYVNLFVFNKIHKNIQSICNKLLNSLQLSGKYKSNVTWMKCIFLQLGLRDNLKLFGLFLSRKLPRLFQGKSWITLHLWICESLTQLKLPHSSFMSHLKQFGHSDWLKSTALFEKPESKLKAWTLD